jgi:hypothetical protein
MVAQCRLGILNGLIDGFAHLMRFELKMELVGVQLGDLSGLTDQAIEPVAFFIDYLEQISALGWVEIRIREKCFG